MIQEDQDNKTAIKEQDAPDTQGAPQRILPKIFGLLIFVAMFLLCLVMMEVVFWYLTPSPSFTLTQKAAPIKHEAIAGHVINEDGVYKRSFVFQDGSPPIDITTTLRAGYRFTPLAESDQNKFALFFGDSFTFGEGVSDNETLPCFFGQITSSYRPYNFGIPGGSVQQMYLKLLNEELSEVVEEDTGIAFYWFLGFHTNRVVGGMPAFNKWADIMPCFELENDALQYKGSFREAHPHRALLYDWLYKSHTVRYTRFFLPLIHTPYHYQLTSRMLWESVQLFKAMYPESEFVVLFWDDRVPYLPVKDTLDDLGVSTLLVKDFLGGIDNPLETGETLPDGHPNGKLYQKIAQGLVDSLGGD